MFLLDVTVCVNLFAHRTPESKLTSVLSEGDGKLEGEKEEEGDAEDLLGVMSTRVGRKGFEKWTDWVSTEEFTERR